MKNLKHILSLIFIFTILALSSCAGKSTNTVSKDSDTDISANTDIADKPTDKQDSQSDSYSIETASKFENAVKNKLENNGRPTIIDFSAVWCGPCKMMKPIFEKLAAEYTDRFNFVSIDVDENPDLAEKYQVQSIPAFVFLDEEGKETNRITGAIPESELRNEILNGAWY